MKKKRTFYEKWTDTRMQGIFLFLLNKILLFCGVTLGFLIVIDVIGVFLLHSPIITNTFFIWQAKGFLGYIFFVFVLELLDWYISEIRYKKIHKQKSMN